MNEKLIQKSRFLREFFRRQRSLMERCFLSDIKNDFLITGEDIRIMDDFKKEHKLPEGRGVDPFLSYVINYYKSKKYKD